MIKSRMEKNIWVRLQKENIDILLRNRGFRFTDLFFPYTSGKIGPYYIKSEAVEKNPYDYNRAIWSLTAVIKDSLGERDDYVISGGESRDWVFSIPSAFVLFKPHARLYKDRRDIETDISGRKVVHVADLNNEGSSLRDYWIPTIRKNNGKIENVFFYVERMEEGVDVVKELGLESKAVIYMDDFSWEHLRKEKIMGEDVDKNIKEWREDRHRWAVNMLRTEEGFAEAVRLLQGNERDREKMHKIIRVGYPEIQEEMKKRLEKCGITI
ncbi:hypothetical protein HYV50_02165 [Candidatus Pacearchaeota archaeon]|nr:hypothetical protein [Candidatus Pacearchaeota archaeon]